jgi:hypothetical protein
MGIVINDIIVEDDDLQYKNAVIQEFTNIAPQNWIRYFSEKNNNSNPSRIHQLCMDCIEHFYTFKYLNNYNVPRSIFSITQKIKKVNPKKLPNPTNYMKDRRTRAINTVGRRRNAAKLTRRQLYPLQLQQQQPQYQEIIPEGGRRTNKLKKTRRRQRS